MLPRLGVSLPPPLPCVRELSLLHRGHSPRLLSHSGSSLPTSQDPLLIPRGSSGAVAWYPKTGSVNLRLERDLQQSLAREPTGKGLQFALGEYRQGRNISQGTKSKKQTGER